MWFPDFPALPPEHHANGRVGMRYEDIAQDGALKVGGMPHAIGMIGFGQLWQPTDLYKETRAEGILPILSRLVMQATGGPVSVRNAIEVEGAYQLGHTRDAHGAVNRLLLNMHAELYGPAARTHDPQPPHAGERVHVGRVFAEHVFTRPFGPPGTRKVLDLPRAGARFVPEAELPFRLSAQTLELPEGAEWLEPGLALDAVPLVFGLTHTDSNQHVNSLVYPQLFEDAALRRAHELGRDTSVRLVEHIDIAFRKPCFAGERMWLWQRAFVYQGRFGTVGYLGPREASAAQAHCACFLRFRHNELGEFAD
jgi:hypothetical protein